VDRLARPVVIEQQTALVEKFGLRRIEVFRLGARLQGPAAKGDDAARAVVDREYHALAEPVVRDRDALAVGQQPSLDHLLRLDAARRQGVAQGVAVRLRIAKAELALRRRIETAVGQIAARLGAGGLVQVRLEDLLGDGEHLMQAGALAVAFLALATAGRHRNARHASQPLDRLGEAQALGFGQEREDVAVLA